MQVELQGSIRRRRMLRHRQMRIGPRGRDIGRGKLIDDLQRAGSQIDQPHRAVGDRAVDDPVDMDRARVPVAGKPIDGDVVLRHPIGE
jgi:hypothetical protein